jgi:hypothetical protein
MIAVVQRTRVAVLVMKMTWSADFMEHLHFYSGFYLPNGLTPIMRRPVQIHKTKSSQ